MGPDDQRYSRHQDGCTQVLLDDDVELHGVCQQDHDQVRKEDPGLVVLRPHDPPGEEVAIGGFDDGDIVELVPEDHIDGIAMDHLEIHADWDGKAEASEGQQQPSRQFAHDAPHQRVRARWGDIDGGVVHRVLVDALGCDRAPHLLSPICHVLSTPEHGTRRAPRCRRHALIAKEIRLPAGRRVCRTSRADCSGEAPAADRTPNPSN